MAIRKSFAGQSLLKPGAYSRGKVDNSAGSDIRSNDTIFIVGESTKGPSGSVTGIVEFTASRLDSLIETYGEGPLVDAAIVSVRPSVTPGVGGAGRILIYKTNATAQASATILQGASNYATISGRAFGDEDNSFSVIVGAGTTANQKTISISQLGGTIESLGENAAQNIISIQYTGDATSATLDIAGASRSALILTTTLAGDQTDGSADLSIALTGKTMKQLVDEINTMTGYVATVETATQSSKQATELDPVAAVDISVVANLLRLQTEIVELINTSTRVEAVEADLLGGLVDEATTALAGGAQGISTNADFSNAFAVSLAEDYNVIVPAVSRDAADDIADADLGFTDIGSTYTISAIAAAMSAHLSLRGSVKNRKEAQGMFGYRNASKDAAFAFISNLNDFNSQGFMQDMVFIDPTGNSKVGQPHVFAAAAAGIRLGTDVGEPLTFKFLRTSQVGHVIDPNTLLELGDFNAGLDADPAIEAGVTFAERRGNGFRIVIDNTTYGIDGSFIFNRGSVIEATYSVYKTLRETAELVFVGKKVSNGLADSIKNVIRNKLRELNAPDVQIITSSIDAPEGFREDTFVVTVDGNCARVQVEFKPVQGLDFVKFDFTIGDIQQTA